MRNSLEYYGNIMVFWGAIILIALFILPLQANAATLEVGPDKSFKSIEEAYGKAVKGDVIFVYPQHDNLPYGKVALYVTKSDITFRAALPGVKISGEGFDYTGDGLTPRAIFQFNEGADNCTIEGFEIFGAHNYKNNGAGIRINKANNIRIVNCDIHANENGIMSNGDGTGRTGVNQRIEYCRIHHNGSFTNLDLAHNLYLGGESVTINFCEIYNSLKGHNLKSRAHFTLVQYCYIHDSADRELDFVDDIETQLPHSDAVLVGNIIVKDPNCEGNHQVVNFGKDGKFYRDGKLYLVHNTIVTPFSRSAIMLSSPDVQAILVGNFISDGGTGSTGQLVVGVKGSAQLENVKGELNVFSQGFVLQDETRLSGTDIFDYGRVSPFIDTWKYDYRPAYPLAHSWPAKFIYLPKPPPPLEYESKEPLAWQYKHPAGREERPPEEELTVGAYGSVKK